MRNVECKKCGAVYNVESAGSCPACASGESKMSSSRRRGKAVRGTVKAARILELVSKHGISQVVKRLGVKRSTAYRVVQEATPTSDELRVLAGYRDLMQMYKDQGQKVESEKFYLLLPPKVAACERRGRAWYRRFTKDLSKSVSICYSTVTDRQQIEGMGAMVLPLREIYAVGL